MLVFPTKTLLVKLSKLFHPQLLRVHSIMWLDPQRCMLLLLTDEYVVATLLPTADLICCPAL
jgi:hypothetical protein